MITFKALERGQIRRIVDVQIQRLAEHLAEQEIGLELTPAAYDQLAAEGYDPEYGARPLKRAIQRRVQNLLAEAILSGRATRGDVTMIDCIGGEFGLEVRPGTAHEGAGNEETVSPLAGS